MSAAGSSEADSVRSADVAVLGSGKMGSALALRFAAAGRAVALGSRRAERARQRAAELNAQVGDERVRGGDLPAAAAAAPIVVLAVPYAAQAGLLAQIGPRLRDKLLVVADVALDPEAAAEVRLPPGSSAALEAQKLVAEGVPVVAAFQTMMYRSLLELSEPVNGDALVAGDDRRACQRVIDLAAEAGIRAWDIGPLVNSIACEALTSVLIQLGNAHGSKVAGIRVTGVERPG